MMRAVLLLCVGVIGLSVFVYFSGPRVRKASFDSSITNSSLTKNKVLTLQFDRPIQQTDYTESISIVPEIGFEADTQNQAIAIRLTDSLQSDTEYVVNLQPDVIDSSGQRMRYSFEYSFSAPLARYAYLQRDAELDFDTFESRPDTIREATIEGEDRVIFESPIIRDFTASQSHYAIADVGSTRDSLVVVDRGSGNIERPEVLASGAITNLTLAPRGTTVLYTIQPSFQDLPIETYNILVNRLYAYSIESGESYALTDENGTIIQASKVTMSTDGQVALVRDRSSDYYLVSVFNDFDPILLGSYTNDFGFSKDDQSIIFRDVGDLVEYDLLSAELFSIPVDMSGAINQLRAVNADIYIASSTSDFNREANQLQTATEIQKQTDHGSQSLWQQIDDSRSFRDFTVSYAGDFLAIQLNPSRCEFDSIGVGSECVDTVTQIITMESSQNVEIIRGFNVIWLP